MMCPQTLVLYLADYCLPFSVFIFIWFWIVKLFLSQNVVSQKVHKILLPNTNILVLVFVFCGREREGKILNLLRMWERKIVKISKHINVNLVFRAEAAAMYGLFANTVTAKKNYSFPIIKIEVS